MKWNQKNMAYFMHTPAEVRTLKYYYERYHENMNKLNGLYMAYERPSRAKFDAWDFEIARARGLYNTMSNPVVLTHNTFKFTIGFLFTDNVTGELNFMFITDTYRRYAHLSDLENA